MRAEGLRRRQWLGAVSVLGVAGVGPVLRSVGMAGLLPGAAGLAGAPRTSHAAAAADASPGFVHRRWPSGRPTPPIDLPTWEGGPWRLAEARGQVVVANFWASWCEPCRAELPSLELLAERHAKDKLQVVAVNYRETDGAIRRFLAQAPLSLPILRDSDGGVARAYQIRIFPTTVVFGRDGRAAFTVTGEVDWTGAAARPWLASVL